MPGQTGMEKVIARDSAEWMVHQMAEHSCSAYGDHDEFLAALEADRYGSFGWSGEMGDGQTTVTLTVTVVNGGSQVTLPSWQMGGWCRQMQAHLPAVRISGATPEEVEAAVTPHLGPATLLLVEVDHNGAPADRFLFGPRGAAVLAALDTDQA
jgi:hypothetical protein